MTFDARDPAADRVANRPARVLAGAVAGIVFAAGFLAAPHPATAWPALSRGEQLLPISHHECLTRAQQALATAGYVAIGNPPANGSWGGLGGHGAVILCHDTTGGQIVDVVVATEGAVDGNIPGAERVRLQGLMDRPRVAEAPPSFGTPGPGPNQGSCPSNLAGRTDIGSTLSCTCAAQQTQQGSLWGTDTYTSDSAICRAALHAGVISPQGGAVVVQVLGGRDSYLGTVRNGVSSGSWGAYGGSFVFLPGAVSEPAPPQPAAADCPPTATSLRGSSNSLVCFCRGDPSGDGAVWGSDVYTDDSRICRAALHAGVIGNRGGTVVVTALPGRASYPGSARNGVETFTFGAWPGSFRVQGVER